MKYANIIMNREGRCTIGDDLQLLAIENLYSHMGINYDDVVRIPFSELATYKGEYVILPLSFPFHGYYNGTCITNFSNRIIPVFFGFATLTTNYCIEDLEYIKKYEPIGCRDQYTMEALRRKGIFSYLNGCLTATFPKRRSGYDGRTKIYCVDITDEFIKYIPKEILKDCIFVNHVFFSDECENGTEQKAHEVYENYIEDAKFIITTRMHAALPCMAAGIPVILAKDRLSIRFPMIEKFIHIYTESEFKNIDWNPVSIQYEELKIKILDTCSERLQLTFYKYKNILEISEFYERDEKRELFIEAFTNTVEFLKYKYNKLDCFEYVIWGVTQNGDMVYNYIKDNYPNAKISAIIDRANRAEFCGLIPTTKEWIKGKKHILCFVCAGAAMPEAREYFREIDHQNVYYCWTDGLPR